MSVTGMRELKQVGWISGPDECHCTECNWSSSFIAVDTSVPRQVFTNFKEHRCSDYGPFSHQPRPGFAEVE